MAKVTGIGGIFFKAKRDKASLVAWYERCLGIELADFGGSILNWQEDKANDGGITVWCLADSDSEWFGPSNSDFMVNYRVDDMDGMVARLAENNVEILQGPESHENGRFMWVMDPDGNKVELWEARLWDDSHSKE